MENTKKKQTFCQQKFGKGDRQALPKNTLSCSKEGRRRKEISNLTKKCMIENKNLNKTSADAYNPQLDR